MQKTFRENRLMWVVGRRNIILSDHTELPFDTYWEALVESIQSYSFKPPLIQTHKEEGAPVWGVVTSWHVLTIEEAAARGIEQVDSEALYANVQQWAGERVLYVSPKIDFGFLAEDGTTYPAVIQHLAVVPVPAQQLGQPQQIHLEAVALSRWKQVEDQMKNAKLERAEVDVDTLEEAADTAVEAVEVVDEAVDIVEELRARIYELEEELAALKADEVPVEAEEDDDADAGAVELSRLTARIRKLETAAYADELKRAAVTLGMSREEALEVRASVPASVWAKLTAGAPKASRLSREAVSTPAPAATTGPITNKDFAALARTMAKEEGISITEALSQLRRKNG